MQTLADFFVYFNEYLHRNSLQKEPQSLYEPINYMMNIGGKRVRPILCLMGYHLFGDHMEVALSAAMAVEYFHNFTLVHDDIMDKAPLRRGLPTVQNRYGLPTAILGGDAMLIQSYDYLAQLPPSVLPEALLLFNKTGFEVCEGQEYDMQFETASQVTVADYIRMITLKTAVLLGAALKLGAIAAHAPESDKHHIYEFGRNIGIAFQLHDDYLDVFGDSLQTGKQVGGDIVQNKKTYLLLQALANAQADDAQALDYWLNTPDVDPIAKVKAITSLYKQLNIDEIANREKTQFYDVAFSHLEQVQAPESRKQPLYDVVEMLIKRES